MKIVCHANIAVSSILFSSVITCWQNCKQNILIRFARVSSHLTDFYARNENLTTKHFQQGYRCHKRRKAFSLNFIVDTLNWFLNIIPN